MGSHDFLGGRLVLAVFTLTKAYCIYWWCCTGLCLVKQSPIFNFPDFIMNWPCLTQSWIQLKCMPIAYDDFCLTAHTMSYTSLLSICTGEGVWITHLNDLYDHRCWCLFIFYNTHNYDSTVNLMTLINILHSNCTVPFSNMFVVVLLGKFVILWRS